MIAKFTSFDGLTTEELLTHAYATLKDDNEIGFALMNRLQEVVDTLDETIEGYEEHIAYLMDHHEQTGCKGKCNGSNT